MYFIHDLIQYLYNSNEFYQVLYDNILKTNRKRSHNNKVLIKNMHEIKEMDKMEGNCRKKL